MPKAASLEVNHGTNTAELLLQRVGVIFRDVFLDDLGRALDELRQIERARACSTRRPAGKKLTMEGSRVRAARSRLFALLQAQPCDGAHLLDDLRKATHGRAD